MYNEAIKYAAYMYVAFIWEQWRDCGFIYTEKGQSNFGFQRTKQRSNSHFCEEAVRLSCNVFEHKTSWSASTTNETSRTSRVTNAIFCV